MVTLNEIAKEIQSENSSETLTVDQRFNAFDCVFVWLF